MPPLTSKRTDATPIGLCASASSEASPETVDPLEGRPTVVVGGGTVTVMVAGFVVTAPATLEKTARTSHPFSNNVRGPVVTGSAVTCGWSIQVDPPSTDNCQCTLGVGVPLAAAEKVSVSS